VVIKVPFTTHEELGLSCGSRHPVEVARLGLDLEDMAPSELDWTNGPVK
jgi:hypothetical protein